MKIRRAILKLLPLSSEVNMPASIMCSLVFIGIIGYSRVCGSDVTLECPSGYHVKAWTTYDYEKTLKTDPERNKVKKLMVCALCKPQSRTNGIEVCHDKDFTEAMNTSEKWNENGVERYQKSAHYYTSAKESNTCGDECLDKVCYVTFDMEINMTGKPLVNPPRFSECIKIMDSDHADVMKS